MTLKLTYNQSEAEVLPITLIGSDLLCAVRSELVVSTEIEQFPCQQNNRCDFIEEESDASGLSHCTYNCRCNYVKPCQLLLYARYGKTKSLCDIFRPSSFVLV